VLLVVAALLAVAPAGAATRPPADLTANPVVFVHGGAGSASQFESQAIRFAANGYPADHLAVLEYDSTFATTTIAAIHTRLDALVAELKQRTGTAQVDVMGHSLGTTVLHAYLAAPARAASIGRYVNIDGRTSATPPGGVPTLAIWAGVGTPGRAIGGATNVTLPDQTHVQSATSAEAFAAMFEFLTGRTPATTGIEPENGRKVDVAGRAVIFPLNAGVPGATLEVWRVVAATGQRIGKRPEATPALAADGAWGPVELRAGKHYEFVLLRAGARTHHFYFEPFLRDDGFVRLLTSTPGTGTDAPAVDKGPNHAQLTIIRQKELWGDQGAGSDALELAGTSVCNPATCPRSKLVVGMQVTDVGSDGVTNLTAPVPLFFASAFQSGVDVFLAAATPARGTIPVTLRSRGGGPARTVYVPNLPSATDRITIQLNDHETVAAAGSGG
jgi:pimeloyl-ACP methyl ester carboxylesterase